MASKNSKRVLSLPRTSPGGRNSPGKSDTLPSKALSSEIEERRENERLNRILTNLSVKFSTCVFTYKPHHLAKPVKEHKKTRARLTKAVKGTLRRFSEAVVGGCEENEFDKCIFIPKSQEEEIKQFIREQFKDARLRFENCKFIQRPSTFAEKWARKLRKIFGFIFELTYTDNLAVVEEYTFRLKDISAVTLYVQERIVDKG